MAQFRLDRGLDVQEIQGTAVKLPVTVGGGGVPALSSSSDGQDNKILPPPPLVVYHQRQKTEGDEKSNLTDLDCAVGKEVALMMKEQPTATTLTTTSSMNVNSLSRSMPSSSINEQVDVSSSIGCKRKSSSNEISHPPQKNGPKRKTSGILSTALGWARSQAAELEAFKRAQQNNGPRKPPPPLPIPTRKLAAAQHDLLKAQQARHARQAHQDGDQGAQKFTNNDIPVDLMKELSKWHGQAKNLAEYYSSMAGECKAWAKGEAIPYGLTKQDLDRTKNELKAKFNYCVHDIDNNNNNNNIENNKVVEQVYSTVGDKNVDFATMISNGQSRLNHTPRRSRRARNTKRDDLFVSLEESEEELGLNDEKRLMDTPNLNSNQHGGLLPRSENNILSPYAQFMLDQGDFLSDFLQPLPPNADGAQELLDGALEDFIATLNFSNEEEFDVQACAKPLQEENPTPVKLPETTNMLGMVPTTELNLSLRDELGLMAGTNPESHAMTERIKDEPEALQPLQPFPPNEPLPMLQNIQSQLLETPTIVRMLTLGYAGEFTSPSLKSPSPVVIQNVSPPPLNYFLSGSPDTVVRTPKVT